MLPNPSPRKRGRSRNAIPKPERSLMYNSMQKNSAASVTRMETIWIELNPNVPNLLTKMPILPQKHPARMISIGPIFFLLLSVMINLIISTTPDRYSRQHFITPVSTVSCFWLMMRRLCTFPKNHPHSTSHSIPIRPYRFHLSDRCTVARQMTLLVLCIHPLQFPR